jgi:selenocysteine lyase/cysteine desulfurase
VKDEEKVAEARTHFPTLANWTYLNTAFAAPPPQEVIEADHAFLEQRVDAPDALGSWTCVVDEMRASVAHLIGAQPSEIGFTTAAAEGENIVANGLDWRAGDNVVLDDLAYPTAPVLWQHHQKTHGIEVRLVGNVGGRVDFDDIERVVDRRTRLISVSHISYINGFRYDLRELADLAHAHGAILYADATQSVGALHLKVRDEEVDFLTCGVYKWLLGPVGLSFFYIKEEWQDRLPPSEFGWWQIQSYAFSEDETRRVEASQSPLWQTARRYEPGSLNFQAIFGLRPALQLIEDLDPAWIEERVLSLNSYLREQLETLRLTLFTPAGNRSGICTFFTDEESSLVEYLRRQSIAVTGRTGSGQIRVSPHFYNTTEEIDLLCDAIAGWRSKGRG